MRRNELTRLRRGVQLFSPLEVYLSHGELQALPPKEDGKNPGLWAGGSSCMHEDSHATDATDSHGLFHRKPRVEYFRATRRVGGLCPSFAFGSNGRAYTITFSPRAVELLLFAPDGLNVVDTLSLPPRKRILRKVFREGLNGVFGDTHGGAYFFLDAWERVVIPAADNRIWVVPVDAEGQFGEPLKIGVSTDSRREEDRLTAVLSVWERRTQDIARYWYTTRQGVVGVACIDGSESIAPHRLQDEERRFRCEEIQNSFSVNKKGAFVVSNFALHRFQVQGERVVRCWRKPYERFFGGCPDDHGAPDPKPGQIDYGSGTTPTLIGGEFVVIGDGSSVMNLNVYRQSDGRRVDSAPVFTSAGSACENSVIYHDGAIYVGNTYGYEHPFASPRGKVSGLAKLIIDRVSGQLFDSPERGAWYRPDVEVMSATPKLSTSTGLIFAYSFQRYGRWGCRGKWVLIGIDAADGTERIRVVADRSFIKDRGLEWDNSWGTIALGPGNSVYVGGWKGFIRFS